MTRWLAARARGHPLVRLFLGRFFESELMPPGVAQVQAVIWTLALAAAPPYLLAMIFGFKYGRLPPARVPGAIFDDQLLFVTYAMMVLGFVALVVWEAVFPDRRDVRVLGVLPIAGGVQVLARVTALLLLAALYAGGVNAPGAVVFGITLWRHEAATDPVRGVAAHLIATGAAGLFTFFALVVLQGAVLALAGRALARRLALVLQAVFVIVLLQALLFVPWLGALVRASFDGRGGALPALLPSAWYLALFGAVAGGSRPIPALQTAAAPLATIAAVAFAALLMAASHRRLTRLALETPPGAASPRAAAVRRASAALGRAFAGDSVQRAIAGFVIRTVFRSRTHLTLAATGVGMAAALALGGVMPLIVRFGPGAFGQPRTALLSIPLAFYFVLLGGLRLLVSLPTELRASWAFRATTPADRLASVVCGVRTAGLVAVVLPVAAVATAIAILLWGPRAGALHGGFTVTAGLLLLEIVLIGWRWIPFTREYRMGSASRMAWPIVMLAFSLYTYTLARLEAGLLSQPGRAVVVVAIGLGLTAGLRRVAAAMLAGPPGVTFENDDPEALFGGFGLSEGLAAGPAPPARGAAD